MDRKLKSWLNCSFNASFPNRTPIKVSESPAGYRAMASSSSALRSWRTAFLTLRDETLASPPPQVLLALLQDLMLSHSSDVLVAAAHDLPPHEVLSRSLLLHLVLQLLIFRWRVGLNALRWVRIWSFLPSWRRSPRCAKIRIMFYSGRVNW